MLLVGTTRMTQSGGKSDGNPALQTTSDLILADLV
jgi:hypothetical protein